MGSPFALRRLLLGLLFILCPARGLCGLPPLSDAQTQALGALAPDKPYEVRMHFLQSNERRHDLFFSALRGRGGVYVGVGADQNYTLAASAGATMLYLVDIDEWVIQWHRIYAALVPAAQSPAALYALLSQGREEPVLSALVARWGPEAAQQLLRAYHRDRHRLLPYLRRQMGQQQDGQPTTWLSDPALYAAVRDLMQARRTIAVVGDLHGDHTVVSIGKALREAGLVVRTLYLSNVEQWFRYSPAFRRNVAALPRDRSSVVLRTLARHDLGWPEGDRWHFSVHSLADFVDRLQQVPPALALVQALVPEMVRQERAGGVHGLSWLGGVARMEAGVLPALRGVPRRGDGVGYAQGMQQALCP